MTYDPVFGDVIKTEDVASDIIEESTFDQYGHLIWKKDGKGQVFTKSYDPATGLLMSESGPNNSNASYTYNSRGQVLTKTVQANSQSLVWTNEYNSLGQVTKKIAPDGKFSLYSYNTAGLVASVETNSASGLAKT